MQRQGWAGWASVICAGFKWAVCFFCFVQVIDWIENHGEAFLSKHTGVGKSLHRARALQKRHDDFEDVAQVSVRQTWITELNDTAVTQVWELSAYHVKSRHSFIVKYARHVRHAAQMRFQSDCDIG